MTYSKTAGLWAATMALAIAAPVAAHSVGQVQTAKRIAQQTVVLLDPQGNPTPGGTGTDTKAKVGDILTFVIQFTPVPNGATRGGGGYITEYIPDNTVVVGARLTDSAGRTLPPRRGGQYADGWQKSRHDEFDALGLLQGSLSAHYADTGIFFSTDARTKRTPNDAFITVNNGLLMSPEPTGIDKLGTLLGVPGGPYFTHNTWDLLQAQAYGVKNGLINLDGRGNPPLWYASAVAGPNTHYPFEKVAAPACSDGAGSDYPSNAFCASALDNDDAASSATPRDATNGPIGPWQRIRYAGSETAVGGETNCSNCAPDWVRVGVPTDVGWQLSPDNALPSGTNAVRFAVGELVVGQEYLAEISLRVTGLPLDSTMNADVNCAEVFGGDAAMPQDGKDNTWRYHLASPSCVQLNLFFELSVDKLIAVAGDTLRYTIKGKNLSINPQSGVVVTDSYVPGDVSFVGAANGTVAPTDNGTGTLTWPTRGLTPGEAYTYQWDMLVGGNKLSTLNRATYTSSQLSPSSFSVVALTTIEPIVVLTKEVSVAPAAANPGQHVSYTVVVTNNGTEDATINGASFMELLLPAGFSYCDTTPCSAPTIETQATAPTSTASAIVFGNGLVTIPKGGGTITLVMDAMIGGSVTNGMYWVDARSQFEDTGIGRDVELALYGQAPVIVGNIVQSAAPTVTDNLVENSTTISGTSSEPAGSTITIYVNGNAVATTTVDGSGNFSVTVPTLYPGQHVYATATDTVSGDLESEPSSDVFVAGIAGVACNDNKDNDGDGKVDFPDDPGCTSATDPDETDPPECSDERDNDGDGKTDFPNDPSCSSYLDDDETGPPACSDNVDNDGDGNTDFPNDPGCDSATDVSEQDTPACSNGIDDDGDSLSDYPTDPGCDSPYDDDETDVVGGLGGGGASGTGGGAPTGGADATGELGNGSPPDLGGLGEAEAGDVDSGCGCKIVTAAPASSSAPWWLMLIGGFGLLRRRRQLATRRHASSKRSGSS